MSKMSYDQLCTDVGRLVLFCGNECKGWTAHDFAQAAEFARAHDIDSICCKVADGTIQWHSPEDVKGSIRPAVLAAGRGFVPMTYSYGPRFGIQAAEAAQASEYAAANDGTVLVDMEVEYNNQPGAASEFAAHVDVDKARGLIVSTWADPAQQGWESVLAELEPVVAGFGPQQYTNYLASCESQYTGHGIGNLLPELDLTGEFGPNDPLAITRQALRNGHKSVWLWEYGPALRNVQLVHGIAGLMHESPPPPPPEGSNLYTIQPGDTLSEIGAVRGLSVANLLELNEAELDRVAQGYGWPNCNNGNRIWPVDVEGQPVTIRLS